MSRAATATNRAPVTFAGSTMAEPAIRAAPSTPIRSGSTPRILRSVDVVAPVGGDAFGRSGDGLVERAVLRGDQFRTGVGLAGAVVPVPDLVRLEAGDQRVAGGLVVGGGVLHGRGVAAPDVPAQGAPAQVDPPPAGGLALLAAGAARRGERVDLVGRGHGVHHRPPGGARPRGPGVGSPPDPDARGGGATMANSVHLMPLRDGEGERAGTLLPWLAVRPSAHRVPDRLPEPPCP